MTTAPGRRDERALLGAFGAVALAFFAANVYTQHTMSRVDAASNQIAFNSTPSIEHLAAIRTSVRHVEFLLGTAVAFDGRDRSGVDAAVTQLKDEASAYLTLPTFPGEKALWRELNDSIDAFGVGVERALTQRDAGALQSSRATLGDVAKAADRVGAAAGSAIEFNAANGRELALRIVTLRRNAEWVGYGLTSFLALLTIIAGVLVHRAVRRQRALVESYAALQDRRATELESFASRAAHDILNPVSATQLALALASRQEIANAKVRELVDRALRNLTRIRTVIDGLLQFARAGATPAPGASADVPAVLEDLVDGLRPAADEAGIEVRAEPVAPCRACCSEGVLTSLVSNLVQNAIKYMGEARTRRIVVRATVDERVVHLEVEDSGPGIRPELLADLFRPFVRGATHGEEGIGLGLATVKRLCETHGGRIGVRSVVGRGSTFWFELPRARDAQPAAGATGAAAMDRSS